MSNPQPEVGQRVRLVFCNDVYTTVVPGDCGTVNSIDALGTVHVRWDKGVSLGLIPEEDQWEVVSDGA